MANKKRKNIDLSPDAVKVLTIEAVKQGTVFKLFVEKQLEDIASKLKNV